MAFGGGPGVLGPAFLLIALAGLAVLVTGVRGQGLTTFQALPLVVRLAVALPVALPLIQLIPMPPAVWHALPGQDMRVRVLDAFAFGDAWLPLSLTPAETAYSSVIGLSMLGLFIAVLQLSHDRLRALIILVLGMIGIGIAIGIIQFASGGDSLQFYAVAHRYALIGFFANKNHMGLTLACAVPLAFVLYEQQLHARRSAWILVGLGWLILLILLVAANSRAGLLLGIFAIFVACLRAFPQKMKKVSVIGASLAAVIIVIASFIPAVRDVAARFGRSSEDLRFDILDQGMPLITQYGIVGSGIGSFLAVYTPTEKLEWVNPAYVNHLHNDWLQLIIEAGIPGLIVAIFLLAATGLAALTWMNGTPKAAGSAVAVISNERSYAWAGFVIIAMFAAHSVADYPIRRVGTLVLLVIAFALVFRPLMTRIAPRRTA